MSKWDDRYRSEAPPTQPSKLLVEFCSLLPTGGRALDVAAGGGRHSVYLAQHGLATTAVDLSREGLERGRELARQEHVHVDWVVADLEQFEIPSSQFDVITCFFYRDPALYPRLSAALRPGGLIFYETYTREPLAFSNSPRNPEHLAARQELLRTFRALEVIFYREVWKSRGVASLVARRPQRGVACLRRQAAVETGFCEPYMAQTFTPSSRSAVPFRPRFEPSWTIRLKAF
ncbi:MAG: SAM-dependent methyltransferase [Acidobacteria bacterium]|nr:MAG: SAM-dependent methyltransferase [Acidobacteriota bacterium]